MNVDSKVRRLVMRLYDTTEQGKRYYCEFAGPIGAVKPKEPWIVTGSKYTCVDTGEQYLYNDVTKVWHTFSETAEPAKGGSY